MKSLGEILKTARLDQGLTLEQISQATKIDIKYLKNLEDNRYSHLPDPTFTKGFIRNYALTLGKNPDDLIAIYRRDFQNQKPLTQKPSPEFSLKRAFLSLPRSTLVLIAVGLFAFLGYLSFQYRAILIPPPLDLLRPKADTVTTSPVIIEGKTSSDSLITINTDTIIKPDHSGVFLTELNFAPGDYTLRITATNRFSRSRTLDIPLTIISQ